MKDLIFQRWKINNYMKVTLAFRKIIQKISCDRPRHFMYPLRPRNFMPIRRAVTVKKRWLRILPLEFQRVVKIKNSTLSYVDLKHNLVIQSPYIFYTLIL